jgi:hypothetical protein
VRDPNLASVNGQHLGGFLFRHKHRLHDFAVILFSDGSRDNRWEPIMFRRSLVLILIAVAAWAEKAPLTPETADHATAYMEWVLEVHFTAEQRQQYRQMLAGIWPNSAEAIVKMARVHEGLGTVDESERVRMRATAQREFVRLLESASDDPSRWLLGVYRAAHGPAGLLGRWSNGHVSSIQYRNTYTGVSAPTNGNTFAYEFQPDGTYSFTGLMQSVMYHCTTATFSNESGTYTLEGDTVSLRPEKNPYRMTNNCAPSSNREAPGKLIGRSYRTRITVEGGRRYLELRGEDGAVQKFAESR